MKELLYKFIIIALCTLGLNTLQAGHIVGGDVTYEFVSFNQNRTQVTYKVIFNMYRDRDAQAANYDLGAVFGAYQEQADGSWAFYDSYEADPMNIDTIFVEDDPCIEEDATVGVESAFYETFFTLDIIERDYMIAYQRCCRNRTSNNIQNDFVGSVFDVVITSEAQKLGNNSPTFKEYPSIFICSNYPIKENISAEDREGDELVYSLCEPLQSGGNMGGGTDPCLFLVPTVGGCLPPFNPVVFNPPYTFDEPMGGKPAVTISSNGVLTGIPEILGQYVVAVCIEEYRNGVLLSRLRRDFQFNVVPCQKAIAADLVADSIGILNGKVSSFITACGDNPVPFRSSGIGAAVTDFEWLIINPDGSIFYQGQEASLDKLDLVFPELGEYTGYVAVSDGSQCQDTAYFNITRQPGANSDFEVVLDSCYLAPIHYKSISFPDPNTTITKVEWNLDDLYTTEEGDFEYEFDTRGIKEISLVSFNNIGCSDTLTKAIDYNPPHDRKLAEAIDTTLCYGDSIFFDNAWIKIAGNYGDILQHVITGCDSIGRTLDLEFWPAPTNTSLDTAICKGEIVEYFGVSYSENGTFSHSTLAKVSACDSIIHTINLEVQDYPEINFSPNELVTTVGIDVPMPITITGDFQTINWSPATGLSCVDCPVPTINHDTDTTYLVSVQTEANCESTETISVQFIFVPDKYYYPTILSKDSQLKAENNLFLQTYEEAYNSVTYDLQVIDRWGNLLFDAVNLNINERSQGWSTNAVLPGLYMYRFTIHEYFESYSEIGSVTVVK